MNPSRDNSQKNKLLSLNSFAAIFIYISLLPYYYLPPLPIPFTDIKFPLLKYLPFFFILILSLFAYKHLSANKKTIFRKNAINIFILIYFFVMMLSAFKSEYCLQSFAKTIYYVLTGVWIYFIVLSCALDRKKIERFLAVVLFTSFVVAGYGIISFLIGKDPLFTKLFVQYAPFFNESYLEKEGRIFSSFANPVFLSSYLIMCLPLIFYQFKTINILRRKPVKTSIGLILFLALGLTFSIGSLIALAFALFFYFFNKASFRQLIKKYHRIIAFVFIIGLFILIMITPQLIKMEKYYYQGPYPARELFLNRLNMTRIFFHGRFANRLIKFKLSWQTIKNHPFLGKGLGTIGRGSAIKDCFSMDNMYLRILVETGILGFLSLFVLIALIISKMYCRWKKSTNQEYADFLWIFLTIFAAFFINAFSCDTFYLPSHRIIFWIYAGIALSITQNFSKLSV